MTAVTDQPTADLEVSCQRIMTQLAELRELLAMPRWRAVLDRLRSRGGDSA